MKICPSCGTQLDDKETKCSICNFIFERPAPGEAPKKDGQLLPLQQRLNEMRKRIRSLTGEEPVPEEEPPLPEPELEPEVSEPGEEIFEEPVEEIEEEVEYEEVTVEKVHPVDQRTLEDLGKVKAKEAEGRRPARLGRKITAEELQKQKQGINKKQVALAAAVVIIIIVASFIFLLNQPLGTYPSVDGNLSDWNDSFKYESLFLSDNHDIDFLESSVQYYQGHIYWYFKIAGELYKTSAHVTSYALIMDLDGDPYSGFMLSEDFGADMMVKISGSGGKKISSTIFYYSTDEYYNWSAWVQTESVPTATLISQIETRFPVPSYFSQDDGRFVSVSFDGISEPSATPYFCLEPGVLIVQQKSLIPSSGIIQQSDNQPVLELTLRAYGSELSLDSINPEVLGAEYVDDIGSIIWQNENEMETGRTLQLKVNCSSITLQERVTVHVVPDSFDTEYPSVMVLGKPAIGYIESIPTGITIDGCFADWTDFNNDFNDPIPLSKKNIDILRTAHSSSDNDAYFYAEVVGDIFKGSLIPENKAEIMPGELPSEPAQFLEKVSGEDVLQIYIDVDPDQFIGAPLSAITGNLMPDYLLEVRGRNGMITEQMLLEWDNEWSEMYSASVEAAIDDHRIEIGFSKSQINDLNGSMIAIVTTDWIGYNDTYLSAGPFIDPFKINLVGNVWGSLDGTSWVPKADVLTGTNSLIDLASDSYSNLYAIFSNGTVYRSTDAANSWTRFIDASYTGIVGLTTDGVSQLYAITSDGMTYNASLSGGTWAYRGDITTASDIVDLDWANGATPGSTVLYAVRGSVDVKILRSNNGGVNWAQPGAKTQANSSVTAIAAIRNGSVDLLYVLESDGDIRYSNDSADSWNSTHISVGGSSDFIISPCVDLDIDSEDDLWVVRAKGEVYKLDVSAWAWQTIYSSGDVSDINSISTMPIPEFGEMMFSLGLLLIPAIFFIIRSRKRR